MKAHATLKNLDSESCKHIIVRNLNRILDIRIIDIDVENGILHFLYNGRKALEQVKKELGRIGYPVQQCDDESARNTGPRARKFNGSPISSHRARRPYYATGQ